MKDFFVWTLRYTSCPCRHCHSKTTEAPGAGAAVYIPAVFLLSDWSDFEGAWAPFGHMIVQMRMLNGCGTSGVRLCRVTQINLWLKIDKLRFALTTSFICAHSSLCNSCILRVIIMLVTDAGSHIVQYWHDYYGPMNSQNSFSNWPSKTRATMLSVNYHHYNFCHKLHP